MNFKNEPAAIAGFLEDTSNLKNGWTPGVFFPETLEEVAALLRNAHADGRRYTIAGNGTGTTGARIPFGDHVIAMQKLDSIGEVERTGDGRALLRVEGGALLQNVQSKAAAAGWIYPPDPTEKTCFIGSTISNNSTGSRSLKYGPTRNHVQALKVALPQGDILDIERGQYIADAEERFHLDLPIAGRVAFRIPDYQIPATSKHNAGYWSKPGMDLIDLFIGSEGTLGVILEATLLLQPAPERVIACLAWFQSEEELLDFVGKARAGNGGVSPRALELFDRRALEFLRQSYPEIAKETAGAIYFEEETTAEHEDTCLEAWLELMEQCGSPVEQSWAALDAEGLQKLRDFRHQLPVLVNEWLSRQSESKVSTDMALPDERFADLFRLYRDTCDREGFTYIIFGHIGNAHLHLNILPRNHEEFVRAKTLYRQLVSEVLAMGGTLSAEHGIGKLKSEYLVQMYGRKGIMEMVRVKKAFDPYLVLNIGNMIPVEYYESET
ncbi:FAD-binding oxidoreductase [Chlorobaculum sp. MV4-Y]|uniref:FAD-binding oxidoreductase n=1 Tax=Chlorobaculum sp. MV4-Y TaxID=2976335 RepID=UPI0021AF0756|nr:FAD-binding oxidoreductase [Chlorobaculum sp. MV4-Y]UWX57060.1 FAD-binding oxidoreductase [Chlorobaculum sp. MV4-Y]